jgi:hypothetical protein
VDNHSVDGLYAHQNTQLQNSMNQWTHRLVYLWLWWQVAEERPCGKWVKEGVYWYWRDGGEGEAAGKVLLCWLNTRWMLQQSRTERFTYFLLFVESWRISKAGVALVLVLLVISVICDSY